MKNELLCWLEDCYFSYTDGDWEHSNGIKIETLDNPGWLIKFAVEGTWFEGLDENYQYEVERSENNWIYLSRKKEELYGACGPKNLIEMLEKIREIHESLVEEE